MGIGIADDDGTFARRVRDNLRRFSHPRVTTRGGAPVVSSSGHPLRTRGRTVPVYSGLGLFKHPDADQTVHQIQTARAAGARGFCLFSYGSLFPTTDDRPDARRSDKALMERRVLAIKALSR